MTGKNILILGATSAIAENVARIYAERGDNLFLVARNESRLSIIVKDLQARSSEQVNSKVANLADSSGHKALLDEIVQDSGVIDVVLIAYGTLGDQKKCEQSFQESMSELTINCISVISLLTELANYFEQRQAGTIAVISSVAGDRGRQSNYVYGTAKGALSIFLQGLRNRLSQSKVQVLTIKPGFVDTPMTKEFKKGLLWAKPESVAKSICKAIERKKDVLYVPFFWRYIMLIIKSIPEGIFKKLKL